MSRSEIGWWTRHPFTLIRYKRFLSKKTCLKCRKMYNDSVKALLSEGAVTSSELDTRVFFKFEDLCVKCRNHPIILDIKKKVEGK